MLNSCDTPVNVIASTLMREVGTSSMKCNLKRSFTSPHVKHPYTPFSIENPFLPSGRPPAVILLHRVVGTRGGGVISLFRVGLLFRVSGDSVTSPESSTVSGWDGSSSVSHDRGRSLPPATPSPLGHPAPYVGRVEVVRGVKYLKPWESSRYTGSPVVPTKVLRLGHVYAVVLGHGTGQN